MDVVQWSWVLTFGRSYHSGNISLHNNQPPSGVISKSLRPAVKSTNLWTSLPFDFTCMVSPREREIGRRLRKTSSTPIERARSSLGRKWHPRSGSHFGSEFVDVRYTWVLWCSRGLRFQRAKQRWPDQRWTWEEAAFWIGADQKL